MDIVQWWNGIDVFQSDEKKLEQVAVIGCVVDEIVNVGQICGIKTGVDNDKNVKV